MSMLARYRKAGGFQQLLLLIETCTQQKRQQLLKLIEAEDPSWAKLITTKMVTLEKVFSWDPMHISEVTTQIVPRTLAILLHGLPRETFDKATTTMPPMKRREIESLYEEQSPNASEVEAARIQLLTKVRELEDSGRLNLAQIDPAISLKEVKVA